MGILQTKKGRNLLFLFLAFLLLIAISNVEAKSDRVFNSCTFDNSTDIATLTCDNGLKANIWWDVNGQQFPKQVIDTSYLIQNGKLKFSSDLTMNGTFLANAGVARLRGLQIGLNINFSGNNVQQVGSGLLQSENYIPCKTELGEGYCKQGYTFGFGDAARQGKKDYLFTVSEDYNENTSQYRLIFDNFTDETVKLLLTGNVLRLDPDISDYNFTFWNRGAFNNTQVSANAVTKRRNFANYSFVFGGRYFSGGLIVNHSAPNILNTMNWSWYEAAGMNSSDQDVLLSMHFENDTQDSSRFNTTGNLTGAKFNNSCQIGQCYKYDGTNSFIEITNNTLLDQTRMTITGWINAFTDANGQMIVAKKQDTGAGYYVFITGTGKLNAQFTDGVLTADVNSTLNVDTNKWLHYAVVREDDNVTLYINGSQVESVQQVLLGSTSNAPTVFRIGRSQHTSNYNFNGSIDETHVWDRALSGSEIKKLYQWELGRGLGNYGYIQNFTTVTTAVRGKNFSFSTVGLLAWWDLGDSTDNETSVGNETRTGTVIDLIGSNIGTVGTNVSLTNQGVIGKSLNFTGKKDGTVNFSREDLLTDKNFTVCAWFKQENRAANQLVLGSGAEGNGARGFNFRVLTNGTLSFRIFNNSGDGAQVNGVFGSFLLSLNTWYDVCGMWNDTNNTGAIKLYVNGALDTVATSVKSAPIAGVAVFTVGGSNAGGFAQNFNGTVDDIKIWNRTLSDQEISDLYNGGNPTGVGGQESNWSAFSAENSGGNATFGTSQYANLFQYRATFSNDQNYSPFLNNVTLTYSPPIVVASVPDNTSPVVSLNLPDNAAEFTTTIINFSALVTDDIGFGNASLYYQNSTGWFNVVTNTTLTNNTNVTFQVTLVKGQNYTWNIQACDASGNCAFDATNRTLRILDGYPRVTLIAPPDGTKTKTLQQTFFALISDDTQVVNASFYFTNEAGVWVLNQTNTTLTNNTNVTFFLGLRSELNYIWNVRVCDNLGQCLFAPANFTITIDAKAPNVSLVSPSNASINSGQTVIFDAFLIDGIGLGNATLYILEGGVWKTNGTVTNPTNNSDVTFNRFLSNNTNYTWNVQSCDPTGNCGFNPVNWTVYVLIPAQVPSTDQAKSNDAGFIVFFVALGILFFMAGWMNDDYVLKIVAASFFIISGLLLAGQGYSYSYLYQPIQNASNCTLNSNASFYPGYNLTSSQTNCTYVNAASSFVTVQNMETKDKGIGLLSLLFGLGVLLEACFSFYQDNIKKKKPSEED